MWEAQAQIEVHADPEAVWALWEHPARWKDWNEQIAKAHLLGAFAVGERARIRFRRQLRPLRFTITALEPQRLFTDETRLPGVTLGHEHSLQSTGGTATIRHRLYLEGPAERLYALLMGRQMRRSVTGFVTREQSLLADA